jgi:hypothetical protein
VERVASDQIDLREPGGQMIGQLRIEFDGNDAGGAFQQVFGKRAFSGADLGNERLTSGTSGNGDAAQDGLIGEEVLA